MCPKKIIVYSTVIKEFMQNRILDRNLMKEYPGGTSGTDLAEVAERAGYEFMTADIFLAQKPSGLALLLSDMGAGPLDILIQKGVIPAVCLSLESPIIAYNFYHNVSKVAGRFEHCFLWSGTEKRMRNSDTIFHPIYWPNQLREVVSENPWEDRKLLTFINSNKRAFQFELGKINPIHPKKSLGALRRYIKNHYIKRFDPWMQPEIYLDRLYAIEHFSHNSQFDMYGTGWSEPVSGTKGRFDECIKRCYRGKVKYKYKALQKYKFVICFENTSFPGYITDKIFDCFFADSIPIYYGAPDIHENIPGETFIDFRDFQNYNELEEYLLSIGEKEAHRYLEAASDFLESKAFDKFHVSDYIRRMIAVFDEITARYG